MTEHILNFIQARPIYLPLLTGEYSLSAVTLELDDFIHLVLCMHVCMHGGGGGGGNIALASFSWFELLGVIITVIFHLWCLSMHVFYTQVLYSTPSSILMSGVQALQILINTIICKLF